MPFSLDHVVLTSDDLDHAIANARSAGFTVVPGGTHGGGISHNALIGLADGAYLELFAPTDRGRTAEHRWFPRIRRGGGMADFCLIGSGLAREVAAIRGRGITYSEPFAMERLRPDGVRLAWSLSTPPGANGETGWPFMIEDETPRELRVPHADEQVRHENGASGVAGMTVLVRDLAVSTRSYEAILGTPAQASASASDGQEPGPMFWLGKTWIRLRAPDSPDEAAHLDRHGQGPYQLTLRRGDGPVSPDMGSLLDPTLFSGARIAIA